MDVAFGVKTVRISRIIQASVLVDEAGPYLHVFPQRTGVSVRFVAHLAQVGLIRSVNVHVLLSVTAVRESSVTAFKFTLERLLPWK